MLQIKKGSFTFPKHRGSGPLEQTEHISPFETNVKNAYAALQGTEYGFSPNDDHHLGRVTVKVRAEKRGNTVDVIGTFGVRDWSDDWDDNYEGTIDYLVFIEL